MMCGEWSPRPAAARTADPLSGALSTSTVVRPHPLPPCLWADQVGSKQTTELVAPAHLAS